MKKVILWVLGILIGVPALLFLAIVIISGKHENITRKLLEQELTNLPAPSGCKEASREYLAGSLGTVSTWFVNYDCQTTGGQAYEAIIANLSQHAYQEDTDYSKEGPGIFYSFTYSSDRFTAQYDFKPQQIPTLTIEQKDLLQKNRVTGISLGLTRKYLGPTN